MLAQPHTVASGRRWHETVNDRNNQVKLHTQLSKLILWSNLWATARKSDQIYRTSLLFPSFCFPYFAGLGLRWYDKKNMPSLPHIFTVAVIVKVANTCFYCATVHRDYRCTLYSEPSISVVYENAAILDTCINFTYEMKERHTERWTHLCSKWRWDTLRQ